MIRKGELILRDIAGENILVPVGETALRIQGMIALSESGALLWQALEQERTEEELVALLLEEYEVTPDEARADVTAFLDRLRGLELI